MKREPPTAAEPPCVFPSRRPYWSTGWLEPAVTLQRSDTTTQRGKWSQSKTNRRWWMVWYHQHGGIVCAAAVNHCQFNTKLCCILIQSDICNQPVYDHSESLLVRCDCVAVHPMRILRWWEQRSAGEGIKEEKFTRRQADVCSATQGKPAGERSMRTSREMTCWQSVNVEKAPFTKDMQWNEDLQSPCCSNMLASNK